MTLVTGRLQVRNASGAQHRMEYDATNYVDFTTNSTGDLTIAPSGGDVTFPGDIILSSASPLQSYKLQIDASQNFVIHDGDAGVDRVVLNNQGNLGLGTTDIEAWGSGWKAMQAGDGAAIAGRSGFDHQMFAVANTYYNGTNWIYRTANKASSYTQTSGTHVFDVAASGTAGNAITWTTALTINNAGLLIPNLPTTAPATSGALWNDAGTVKVA